MIAMLNKIKDFFCKPRIILIYKEEKSPTNGTAFMLLNDASNIDVGATLQIGNGPSVSVVSTDVISVKLKGDSNER